MKKRQIISYKTPRRDCWLTKLSEEGRLDALSLRKRMGWKEALAYLKGKYDITVKRTAYYDAIKRYASNEIAIAQLKAATTPPTLEHFVRIADAVERIDKTLKRVLARIKNKHSM